MVVISCYMAGGSETVLKAHMKDLFFEISTSLLYVLHFRVSECNELQLNDKS